MERMTKVTRYCSNCTLGPTNPGPMPATVKRDYDDNPRNDATSSDQATTVAGNDSLMVFKD
jgi:hypothetical protein